MPKTSLLRMLLVLCLWAASFPISDAEAEPAANPGLARVWFLWPSDSPTGYDNGAAPTIYANETPLGAIRGGSKFFRDFAPGAYRFTVDPFGQPTRQALTLQLAPGTQSFIEVQWAPTWEEGYPSGRGMMASSFFVLNMSPQLAQAYLPTLTDLSRPAAMGR